jgi:2-polyprenyl-3-methyl-5-hydroxy-6-metoxy-1,4-benzoquinol methylase
MGLMEAIKMTDDSNYDLSDFQGLFVADEFAHCIQGAGGSGPAVPNVDFQRLKDFALMLLNPRPGQKLLEIGCGRGANAVPCALQGCEVFGQDLDATSVAKTNRHFEHFGLRAEARQGDATRLLFDANTFDAVLSSDFHEHLTAPQQLAVLTEAHRVLRPGGKLVLKTPNITYLKTSLWIKRIGALFRFQDPRGFVIPHTPGTRDPQHVGLTSRWRLTRQLVAAGFLNYRFHYAPLRRFGVSALLEVLSTEIPVARDVCCEDLFVVAYKPICLSHFPPPLRSQAPPLAV